MTDWRRAAIVHDTALIALAVAVAEAGCADRVATELRHRLLQADVDCVNYDGLEAAMDKLKFASDSCAISGR